MSVLIPFVFNCGLWDGSCYEDQTNISLASTPQQTLCCAETHPLTVDLQNDFAQENVVDFWGIVVAVT